MNGQALPGEVLTEKLSLEETRNNAGIQEFVQGLDPYQRARFIEIAHHLAFVGFENGLSRVGPEQRAFLRNTYDRIQARSYIQGFTDALSIIEEGQGGF